MRYEYDSIDKICNNTVYQAENIKGEIRSIIDRYKYEGVIHSYDTWFESHLNEVERSIDDLIQDIYLIARRSK